MKRWKKRYLTKFADQVHLIAPTPTLKARPALATEVEEQPKIALRLGARLKEIVGNGHVEGVRIQPRSGEPETPYTSLVGT